jgi:hypothetical protein
MDAKIEELVAATPKDEQSGTMNVPAHFREPADYSEIKSGAA